jgi:hypothetical protein
MNAVLVSSFFFFFFFGSGGLTYGQNRSHATNPFVVMSFLEIGSHKLFAQAGFEL